MRKRIWNKIAEVCCAYYKDLGEDGEVVLVITQWKKNGRLR